MPLDKIYKMELGAMGEQLINDDKTLNKNKCILLKREERNLELYGDDFNRVNISANSIKC